MKNVIVKTVKDILRGLGNIAAFIAVPAVLVLGMFFGPPLINTLLYPYIGPFAIILGAFITLVVIAIILNFMEMK